MTEIKKASEMMVPSAERVQSASDKVVGAFGKSIDLIANGLAAKTNIRTSRFGRLRSIEGVISQEEFDEEREGVEVFASTIASMAFREGFAAAQTGVVEGDSTGFCGANESWVEGVTPRSDVDRIKGVALFKYGSPDLIGVGWENFTVSQMEAFSSLFRLATAVGIEYERLTNKLGREPTAEEASTYFGLELTQEFTTVDTEGTEAIS